MAHNSSTVHTDVTFTCVKCDKYAVFTRYFAVTIRAAEHCDKYAVFTRYFAVTIRAAEH